MTCSTVLILLFGVITITGAEQHCDSEQCFDEEALRPASGSMMLQVQSQKTADLKFEEGEMAWKQPKQEIAKTGNRTRARQGKGRKKHGRGAHAAKHAKGGHRGCAAGGVIDDGHCWYVAIPATSCEETCAEANLQYDDATDLGPIDTAADTCLRIAGRFGFQGKPDKILDNSWSGQGCGCTVYKVPAYGKGDTVRLKRGSTNAKCAKTSAIAARMCACKARVAIGEKCEQSSECLNGYCVGTCIELLSAGEACAEHSSCQTAYCDPTAKQCTTLTWNAKQGAFAMAYRKPGAKRSTSLSMPGGTTWEAMSQFPKGFCLGYYPRSTGCLVARGIHRAKTIAIAKLRCTQSAECRAVWCCATGCPATTCYATKAEAPNHLKRDCPDAPGSFGETKYANTMYVKDGSGKGNSPSIEPAPAPVPAPSPPEPPRGKDEASFKLMKKGAICKSGRKRVKANKVNVEECSESVRQEGGTAFLFLAQRQLCFHAPKFEECKKRKALKRSKFDYYDLLLDVDDEMAEDE